MISKLVLTSGFGDLIVSGLQSLTYFIDHAIYGLVKIIYSVFTNIAGISLLSSSKGQDMAVGIMRRVYVFMAIIMVFVLAYNLLNYIIDPDKVNDKKMGASTFIKDILISIALIALTPTIFTKLYSLQSIIISDGVISNLILGGAGDASSAEGANDVINNGANPMIASTYAAFLYPADGKHSALDCGQQEDTQHTEFYDSNSEYCEAYWATWKDGELSHFGDLYNKADYSFTPFLSTIGGIALIYFMLVFSISLGKRVGKMALLELIAPLPLTLEILPNKKGLRDNWIKTSLKVFGEVFIYMGFMFLVIFLISLVPGAVQTIFDSGSGLVGIVSTVIIIFGLLIFGKEAPKMVCDLLGIKDTNFLKQSFADAKQALAYGTVGAGLIGGTASRMTSNAVQTYQNARKEGRGVWSSGFGAFRSGVAGGVSGFGRTIWGARNVKNVQDARRLTTQVSDTIASKRTERDAYRKSHGGTFGGTMRGHASDLAYNAKAARNRFIGNNTAGAANAKISAYSKFTDIFKGAKVNPKTDEQWLNYQKEMELVKSKINATPPEDVETKKALNKQLDFLQGQQNSRSNELITNKKREILEALANTQAELKFNPTLAEAAKGMGIDALSLNSKSSNDDFIAVYKKLKTLEGEVKDRITDERVKMAEDQRRQQSLGSSDKDKK